MKKRKQKSRQQSLAMAAIIADNQRLKDQQAAKNGRYCTHVAAAMNLFMRMLLDYQVGGSEHQDIVKILHQLEAFRIKLGGPAL